MQKDGGASRQANSRESILAVLALLVLAAVMLAWWRYPFPSGKRPGFVDFLMFFGREAVLLLFFGACFILSGLIALWRVLRRALSRLVGSHDRG